MLPQFSGTNLLRAFAVGQVPDALVCLVGIESPAFKRIEVAVDALSVGGHEALETRQVILELLDDVRHSRAGRPDCGLEESSRPIRTNQPRDEAILNLVDPH
ncbi:MAG: hypothetical protein B7C54_10490 [Acidimicrobiales bacterium mtb01]|nr:hypothetical protein [Actinomycetota bacterium]TEX45498.1 MAG: hypothetical protein B7C54_10490 [Acidimicrobiales bacterium mtb01]